MTISALYLNDGTDTLQLDDSEGIVVTDLDLGFPAVRAVTDVRADADGMYDSTAYFGERVVAMTVQADGNGLITQWDKLSRFLRPSRRPYLYFTVDGSARRIRLRPSNRSSVLTAPAAVFTAQLQWVAPDGVMEAASVTEVTAFATSGGEDGRQYDLTFDREYADISPVGAVSVTNVGSATVWPVLRLYGPATNPIVEDLTNDRQLRFVTGLTAGQFLEVNIRDRTVRLNGLVSQNRYQTLDFVSSTWFGVDPGTITLRYRPEVASSPSRAIVTYRTAWL